MDTNYLIPTVDEDYSFSSHFKYLIPHLNNKRPVLLSGPQGCGKTTSFLQHFARKNRPVLRINLNGETSISDLVGYFKVANKEMQWMSGAIQFCMENGIVLLVDEIDCGTPEIMSIFNPVLEERPVLVLKEKDNTPIYPKEGFQVVATANSVGWMQGQKFKFAGTGSVNAALLDRFFISKADYLPLEEEIRLLMKKAPFLVINATNPLIKTEAGVACRVANGIREAFMNNSISTTMSFRGLLDYMDTLNAVIYNDYADDKGNITIRIDQSCEARKKAMEISFYPRIPKDQTMLIDELIQRYSDAVADPDMVF